MISPLLFATSLLLAAAAIGSPLMFGGVRARMGPVRSRHRRSAHGRHATRGRDGR